MPHLLTCVVSRGQSNHPDKRALEDNVADQLAALEGVEVLVVPNLYDLKSDSATFQKLREITGDLVFFSWLYERGTRWILDRNDVRGQIGESLIQAEDDEDDEDDWEEDLADEKDETPRVNDSRDIPSRRIYCIELRVHDSPEPYRDEVRRLLDEAKEGSELMSWISGKPDPEQLERYLQPATGLDSGEPSADGAAAAPAVQRIEEQGGRRWYPVIDFSRCTNCMECIDFCLFGVYGVDQADTILVEQPDNCRKGCPACSRVCPENAIIFPQHKTPAIAGAPSAAASLKIDLSQLFGAPDAVEVAAQERDEQLLLAGRDAVGMSVGVPKRQADQPARPKDDLDNLVDELDQLDL